MICLRLAAAEDLPCAVVGRVQNASCSTAGELRVCDQPPISGPIDDKQAADQEHQHEDKRAAVRGREAEASPPRDQSDSRPEEFTENAVSVAQISMKSL